MSPSGSPQLAVGSLVRVRERDWVVLPSDDQDVVNLRPLSGTEAETCGIYRPLEGQDLAGAECRWRSAPQCSPSGAPQRRGTVPQSRAPVGSTTALSVCSIAHGA
jgi:hypothetical protein